MFKNSLQATALVSSVIMSLGMAFPTESTAVTVEQDVNLRKGASSKNKKIGVLEKGEEVKLLSVSNNWYKVQDSEGNIGWSDSQYMEASDDEIEAAKNKISGEVKEDLNFRTGPSTDYKILKVFPEGEQLKILSESDGWYKVQNSDGEIGWSNAKYIKASDKEVDWSNKDTEDTNGTVKSNANVRKGASTKYEVVGTLKAGQKIKVISSLDGWYKVKLSDGTVGWTYGSHIDSSVSLKYTDYTKSSSSKSSSKSSSSAKSSNSYNVSKGKMVVSATAYSGDSITATGTKPKWGTIAVDPSVIPYGTKVYIPRFDKVFIAEDRGGGIKGNKIDIFMNSESDCYNWGVRSVTIEILE